MLNDYNVLLRTGARADKLAIQLQDLKLLTPCNADVDRKALHHVGAASSSRTKDSRRRPFPPMDKIDQGDRTDRKALHQVVEALYSKFETSFTLEYDKYIFNKITSPLVCGFAQPIYGLERNLRK